MLVGARSDAQAVQRLDIGGKPAVGRVALGRSVGIAQQEGDQLRGAMLPLPLWDIVSRIVR